MKKIICLLIIAFTLHTLAHAQNPPLRVAVNRFEPPFVMQGANKQLFGYDISMMKYICAESQRDCNFIPMDFKNLIPALVNNEADAAIGAIGINAERALQVNFSIPYLPRYSRFLTRSNLAKEPFNPMFLDNKAIGIVSGSVFESEIRRMGIKNPDIQQYDFEGDIIDALANEEIDLALLDAPTTLYWQSKSSGLLKAYGPPMPYGFGLGIAVNRDSGNLLREINLALTKYLKSKEFKKNFSMYLEEF